MYLFKVGAHQFLNVDFKTKCLTESNSKLYGSQIRYAYILGNDCTTFARYLTSYCHFRLIGKGLLYMKVIP